MACGDFVGNVSGLEFRGAHTFFRVPGPAGKSKLSARTPRPEV